MSSEAWQLPLQLSQLRQRLLYKSRNHHRSSYLILLRFLVVTLC